MQRHLPPVRIESMAELGPGFKSIHPVSAVAAAESPPENHFSICRSERSLSRAGISMPPPHHVHRHICQTASTHNGCLDSEDSFTNA